MMMLAMHGAQTVTVPITSSQSWIAPAGVTSINVTGKGASGTPSGFGTTTTWIDTVQGSPSGSGPNSGQISWSSVQGGAESIAGQINNGSLTTGSAYGVVVVNYPNSNTYSDTIATSVVSGAIKGTASVSHSSGWKTSGSILASDYGQSYITYQYSYSATSGASSSAFGKTFPGGVGGPATSVTYNNVAVTPNSSYPIVVPSGGSVTITYTK